MKDMREKGFCYYCEAKWDPRYKCQKRKLYIIEEIYDTVEGEVDSGSKIELAEKESEVVVLDPGTDKDNPEISLHAILGSMNPRTMRVRAEIWSCGIVALFDVECTHNFVDQCIIEKVGLKLNETSKVKVKIANGDLVGSDGKVESVSLCIHESKFETKAYGLSLAGCNMVLGVAWLQTLGTILWDF